MCETLRLSCLNGALVYQNSCSLTACIYRGTRPPDLSPKTTPRADPPAFPLIVGLGGQGFSRGNGKDVPARLPHPKPYTNTKHRHNCTLMKPFTVATQRRTTLSLFGTTPNPKPCTYSSSHPVRLWHHCWVALSASIHHSPPSPSALLQPQAGACAPNLTSIPSLAYNLIVPPRTISVLFGRFRGNQPFANLGAGGMCCVVGPKIFAWSPRPDKIR